MVYYVIITLIIFLLNGMVIELKKIRFFFLYFIGVSVLFTCNVKALSCSDAIDSELIAEISKIFYLIGAVALVIGIVMGMLDFFKVFISGDSGELKKTASKFVKRLIAIALFFAIPALTSWILDLAGFTSDTCLNDLKSGDNVCYQSQQV